MKVLHIIPNFNSGGAEKMLIDIVKEMKNQNILCEVAVLTKENNFFGTELNKLSIPIYYGPTKKVYSYKNILFLKQILSSNIYDVVHTHLYAPQLFTPMAMKLFNNKSLLVTTEHNTHNRRRDNKLFYFLDYWMYQQYEKIIAISPETKETLIEYLSFTSEKTFVIENGIDLDKYKNAIALNKNEISPLIQADEKLIVMVAAMREQKDHETLIRASKHLPDNYRVVFIGDGERMDEVKLYAQNNGKDNILFLGRRLDIPEILKAADVFVLSSKWEGFGLVVVEAAACGLPVVASDVKGLNGVVKKINGLLFEANNEKELAKKIAQALKLPITKGKNIDSFSIKTTVNKCLDLYKSTIYVNRNNT